jgi:hypothetical protein
MDFRLTYEGPLYATQKDPTGAQPNKRRDHKHKLRKHFHHQLKRLWEVTSFLKTGKSSGPDLNGVFETVLPVYKKDEIASKYNLYGFNFLPLVTRDLHLLCGLDILFLRPDPPGAVLKSGDSDNRVKTLFDALRMPVAGERYDTRTPEDDEVPFYCLLEDDMLITKIAVETDQLLELVNGSLSHNDARLIITVCLRLYELHFGNIAFG